MKIHTGRENKYKYWIFFEIILCTECSLHNSPDKYTADLPNKTTIVKLSLYFNYFLQLNSTIRRVSGFIR